MAELFSAGETVRAEEIVLEVPDGRRVTVLLNATPIVGDEGEVESVVVTMQDMADVEELECLRADFLAMVSHELRAPLTSIKGSAATVLGSSTELDPAVVRQFFRIIEEQADHMNGLVADLLDVARIETGELPVSPEPAEVAVLVDRARSAFSSSGRPGQPPGNRHKGRTCPWCWRTGGAWCRCWATCCPTRRGIRHSRRRSGSAPCRRAFTWLSRWPTRAGAFRLRACPACSASSPGSSPRSRVRARGWGWPSARGSWRPTGDASGPIAKGRAGGRDSPLPCPRWRRPGAGSPVSRHSPEQEGRKLGERVRVLAVDDDPQALRYIRDTLAGAGYQPLAAGNPEEALRLMQEEKPHLALLDLMLSGADGIELMQDILSISDVPVIFLSAYGQEELVARAFDMGAVDYVVKPFSPTELGARIRAALRRWEAPGPAEPYAHGDLVLDFAQRRVTLGDRPVPLVSMEYRMLAELAANAGQVLTYERLLERVWSEKGDSDVRPMRTIVSKLRRKLGDDADSPAYIFTEPRVGYWMPRGEIRNAVKD